MSTTQHTPEPWVTVAHASGRPTLIQSNGKHLAECWSLDRNINCQANAERIVACVNACAGMEDPAKEIAELIRIKKAIEPYDANELTMGYDILLRERDELRAEIARLKNPTSAPTCDELDYDSRS